MSRRRRAAALAAACAFLTTCTVGLAPPARAIGLSEESDLGARFALEARRRLPLLREPAVTAYLQRVGRRIIQHLDAQPFTYRFYVVRESALNAFAVPGGYVYVNAGLLTTVATEAELASVLAHEIVHVHAHHVVRQQEQGALANYATLAGLLLSAIHPALGVGAVTAGAAAQLKYMRQFEQEADHVGLKLLQEAGFDPSGMPRFLRIVQRAQQLNPTEMPPYFLSHPLTEDRIEELEQRVQTMKRPPPRPEGEVERAAAKATVRALTEPRQTVLDAYQERLERAGESAEAQHLLGLVYLHGGQPDRAEPLLARAMSGKSPRAEGDHGRALVRLGKRAEARAAFEQHLRTYPGDAPIMIELGRALAVDGEPKRAAALYEAALTIDPELDDAEYSLAELRGKSGDAYGQWWHLARAFELRGEFERAEPAYEKARDLTAEDSPQREEVEEALRALRRAGRSFGR